MTYQAYGESNGHMTDDPAGMSSRDPNMLKVQYLVNSPLYSVYLGLDSVL